MNAVELIRRKRDGHALTPEQIAAFVRGVTSGEWPDYQVSALLMAIFLRGLDPEETAALTRAMADSGDSLTWDDVPGPKIDKHSSGGVGDKTTLVVVPLAAACGVVVPKLSGRGLGHTGGTVDKLESIPGFRTDLTVPELKEQLRAIGAALMGQTGSLAPADKTLYALRDVTATVDHVPLIAASIMSKKLAENLDGLVLDVKCGAGAFMKTEADARRLAEALADVGRRDGLPTEVVVSAMDAPLGFAVGNALEVREAVETLRGDGPADLTDLCLTLAGRMVRLAGIDDPEAAVRRALDDGTGLEKFRRIVERQGGDASVIDDPSKLPAAPCREVVRAPRGGTVGGIDAEQVGLLAMRLGAGRARKEDGIDPAVGVVLRAKPGDAVESGGALMEVHCRGAADFEAVRAGLADAVTIG